MATCAMCAADVGASDTCIEVPVVIKGKPHRPIPYGKEPWFEKYNGQARCGECGVRLGLLHHVGICAMESCPACTLQLIHCGCLDSPEKQLKILGH